MRLRPLKSLAFRRGATTAPWTPAIGGNFQAGQVALVALADGVAQLRPQVMSVAGRIARRAARA